MLNNTNNEIFKRMIVENKMQNKNNIQKNIAVKDNNENIFRIYPSVTCIRSNSSSGGIDSFIGYTNNKILEDEYELYILCCVNSSDNEINYMRYSDINISENNKNIFEIRGPGGKIMGDVYYDPSLYAFVDNDNNNITLKIPLIIYDFNTEYERDIKARDSYLKCGLNVITFEEDLDHIEPSKLIKIGYKTGENKYVFYVKADTIYN